MPRPSHLAVALVLVLVGCESSGLDDQEVHSASVGRPAVAALAASWAVPPPTTTTVAPPAPVARTAPARAHSAPSTPAPTPPPAASAAPASQGPAPGPQPGDPPDSDFDRLSGCESGHRWDLNTGNGYYGGLQFAASTWRAYGGADLPHQQPREWQIEIARRLWRARGWEPWPVCSRRVGLR